MASGCRPPGAVMVAGDFEETEREVRDAFMADGALSEPERRVLERLRQRRKRSQRVASRAVIAMAWLRGDAAEGRGRATELEAEYEEAYAA